MNGLAAITPKGFQTPPQNQGLGQLMGGQRPSAREQMAIEVVNDDIEPLNLDPKLEAALKLGEAKELLQSANQVLAPNPANVVQQLQQEIPAGIAALTAQMQGRPQMAPQGMPRPMPKPGPGPRPMAPGIMGMAQQMAAANQQGRQAPMPQRPPMPMQNAPQRAPAPRPPMGGLPQLPSNLPRAAQGGIVAFSAGDKVEKEKSFMDKARGFFSGQYSADTEGMTPEQYLQYLKNLREERITQGASAEEIQRIEEAIRSFEGTTTAQGMAGGGIVGFAGPDGSFVESRKYGNIPMYGPNSQFVKDRRIAEEEEEEEERRLNALRNLTANQAQTYSSLIGQGVNLDEALSIVLGEGAPEAGVTEYDPTGEETASISTKPGQEVVTTQVEEEEAFYPPQRLLPREEVSEEEVITGPGRSVDTSTLVGNVDVEEYNSSATALEKLLKEGIEGRLGRDVTEEQEIATARLDELTGLDELRAEQRTAEQARKALRETRFTPEEERRRLLRAGLLGTAEQGLGGFARGTMDAENRIYAEQLEAAQEDVATMDKITDTFQQLGLSKFEAEQNTFKLVEDGINSGLSAGASLANALRQAELTARQQNVTLAGTVRGQDVQLAVAKIQQENSEFSQTLNILIAEETARNPTGTKQEIQSAALEKVFEQDLKSKLALLGVQESDLQRKAFSDAIRAAVDMVAGDISLITDPAARNAKIFELAEQMISMNAFGGQTQTIPTVTNQAQFDALGSGELFIENGQTFRKP